MIAYVIIQRSEELALFVFDEEDNETLLLHRINPDDIYRKQECSKYDVFNWMFVICENFSLMNDICIYLQIQSYHGETQNILQN